MDSKSQVLDQVLPRELIIELKTAADVPKKIDDIPYMALQDLLENSKKALEDGEMILYQSLRLCLGHHRELKKSLEQARRSGSWDPRQADKLKAIGLRVQEVYQSLTEAIEMRSREYELLVRAIDGSGGGSAPGRRDQEPMDPNDY